MWISCQSARPSECQSARAATAGRTAEQRADVGTRLRHDYAPAAAWARRFFVFTRGVSCDSQLSPQAAKKMWHNSLDPLLRPNTCTIRCLRKHALEIETLNSASISWRILEIRLTARRRRARLFWKIYNFRCGAPDPGPSVASPKNVPYSITTSLLHPLHVGIGPTIERNKQPPICVEPFLLQ